GRRGQGEQGQQDGGQSSHEAPLSRNADAYQTTGRSPDYNSSFGGRLGKQQERAVARDRSPAAGRFALPSPGGELGLASTGGPSAWGNERVLAGELNPPSRSRVAIDWVSEASRHLVLVSLLRKNDPPTRCQRAKLTERRV